MTLEIRAYNRVANFLAIEKVSALEDLRTIMIKVTCANLCEKASSGQCENGLFVPKSKNKSTKCKKCRIKSDREKTCARRRALRLLKKAKNEKNSRKNLKRKLNRYTTKIKMMREKIKSLKDRYSSISEDALNEAIKNLPEQMQETVRCIHKYGQTEDKRGMRYSKKWILECLLLSIKSRKGYIHIKKHNILPLPSFTILRTYIKNMKPKYGFDPQLFSMLKKKSASMKPAERRGVLVLDEMQISKGLSFDSDNLSILGFTDLGEHTPERQKQERGDHALVFLFQPFRGQWVQNVAAFLSKGAASGEVHSHLVTECIIMLENSGFYVDVVTSDGASWNKGMWKHFGLKKFEASCTHILTVQEETDEEYKESSRERRLWFCSDFSHLLKNFRNFAMSKEEIMTPDGIFKKEHFRAVIKGDGGHKNFGLKVATKLTPDHLDPQFFQKMHVHKAFDLFSARVVSAMKIYRQTDSTLQDCEPTINLTSRISEVINAMTSRSSHGALTPTSSNYNIIKNFREYLKEWKTLTQENDYAFMTDNTFEGFQVTLTTALEVMEFLCHECDYQFLMTARLNQDALEGMFGMIRGCCGSYDKPDPLLFIQVYRLISFYSLVKPPKGSNVDSFEMFETLLSEKDTALPENKEEWKSVLSDIIERGEKTVEPYDVRHSHDYNVVGVNDFVLAYFSGFLARKAGKWTTCEECLEALTKDKGDLPRDQLIDNLNRGYLKYPSNGLFDLMYCLETAILQTVGQQPINFYTFQHIAKNVLAQSIMFVGCENHKKQLTKTIINYYIMSRTKILCKQYNKIYDKDRKDEQKHRKLSKLVGTKDTDDTYCVEPKKDEKSKLVIKDTDETHCMKPKKGKKPKKEKEVNTCAKKGRKRKSSQTPQLPNKRKKSTVEESAVKIKTLFQKK